MGQSKYETLQNATIQQVAAVDAGVEDSVEQKHLEAELAQIDEETEQQIKEIKATPVNKELLKKQAEAELESRRKANARDKAVAIQQAQHAIEQAELDKDLSVKQAELDIQRKKDTLEQIKEIASENEARKNLSAEQEYDRIVASVDDTEQTINLKIEKAKQQAKVRKREIEIELESIKAKNEAKSEKTKCWKNLYDDTLKLGMALGDKAK
jgi:hypothetical protein